MDIILVPGLWLDGDSWSEVTPLLTDAGHRVHPLTLPGVGAPAAESSELGIADWVAAVTDVIDGVDGPVVLVGHSGGGNVIWGAVDVRPERIARAIFVDTAPPAPGFGISEFELVDGVVPFPGWDFFDEPDVHDLDDETRSRTAALAKSVPARVPTDPIVLSDPRRHDAPVTLLTGSVDREALEAMLEEWPPSLEEYRAIADTEVVELGSGHWPQFSIPRRLAAQILAAVER